MDELQLPTAKRVYSLPTDEAADAAKFDKLLADVEASYFEIDDVVKLNDLEHATEPKHGAQLREGEHGRCVDLSSSNLLPFSLSDTADAVWEFYNGPKKHRGPLYFKTAKVRPDAFANQHTCLLIISAYDVARKTTSDTIVEKFDIEWFALGTRADFRNWKVFRQYVSEDCVKVVWAAIVEPVEFANKSFSSCAYHETGYVVCKKPAVHDERVGPDCTQLIRIRRIMPYITHSAKTVLSSEDQREIGAMIDFVLSLENSISYLEYIEDTLMRQRSYRERNTP